MSGFGKKILLGISGGIAAYKTPELVRRLRERGADVQIVLTQSAREFVTETSLQAVSGHTVRSNIWDKEAEAAMGHIELARWADVVLIAPATAEMLSRLASGAAPDLLTTVCLATEADIVVAPAMNRVMWSNPAVQDNSNKLIERGVRIIGPGVGSQACGEEGAGRMEEPDDIAREVMSLFDVENRHLVGCKVVITAGPTREAIDPVRYISNRSSGKMGYAMAVAARDAGADVTLLSGPVSLEKPAGITVVNILSADELCAAAMKHVEGADIFIAAAAVADYKPAEIQLNKIKKTDETMTLKLVKTPDTLATIAASKGSLFCVGFAAETSSVREYALQKLERKNLDMIIANRVGKSLGFDADENAVEVYWKSGEQSFPTAAKSALAVNLMKLIGDQYRHAKIPQKTAVGLDN